MWNWLKRFWQPAQSADIEYVKNAEAKKFLNNLRENELSVGASLRRGETINTAPGQTSTETQTIRVIQRTPQVRTPQTHSIDVKGRDESDDEDFATSMVMGAVTGSSMIGYMAGGSMTGGLIGAASSDTDNISTTSVN